MKQKIARNVLSSLKDALRFIRRRRKKPVFHCLALEDGTYTQMLRIACVKVTQASFGVLDFLPANEFDLVFSNLIDILPDEVWFFDIAGRLKRVLQPGAYIVFVVSTRYTTKLFSRTARGLCDPLDARVLYEVPLWINRRNSHQLVVARKADIVF